MTDFDEKIIDEFRSHDGQVGGPFAGAPMVLVHHVGRKSGEPRVNPMMYRPDPDDARTIHVFASAAGRPRHPAWYHNLLAAGTGSVEVGTPEGIDSYDVEVRDVVGARRDEIYAAQAADYPGFAGYAKKTEGIRTIPVLALTRR